MWVWGICHIAIVPLPTMRNASVRAGKGPERIKPGKWGGSASEGASGQVLALGSLAILGRGVPSLAPGVSPPGLLACSGSAALPPGLIATVLQCYTASLLHCLMSLRPPPPSLPHPSSRISIISSTDTSIWTSSGLKWGSAKRPDSFRFALCLFSGSAVAQVARV